MISFQVQMYFVQGVKTFEFGLHCMTWKVNYWDKIVTQETLHMRINVWKRICRDNCQCKLNLQSFTEIHFLMPFRIQSDVYNLGILFERYQILQLWKPLWFLENNKKPGQRYGQTHTNIENADIYTIALTKLLNLGEVLLVMEIEHFAIGKYNVSPPKQLLCHIYLILAHDCLVYPGSKSMIL